MTDEEKAMMLLTLIDDNCKKLGISLEVALDNWQRYGTVMPGVDENEYMCDYDYEMERLEREHQAQRQETAIHGTLDLREDSK